MDVPVKIRTVRSAKTARTLHETAAEHTTPELHCSPETTHQPPLDRLVEHVKDDTLEIVSAHIGDTLVMYAVVRNVDGRIGWLVLAGVHDRTVEAFGALCAHVKRRHGGCYGHIENDDLRRMLNHWGGLKVTGRLAEVV